MGSNKARKLKFSQFDPQISRIKLWKFQNDLIMAQLDQWPVFDSLSLTYEFYDETDVLGHNEH